MSLGEVLLGLNSTMHRVAKTSPLELVVRKVARPLGMVDDDDEVEVDLEESMIKKDSIEIR